MLQKLNYFAFVAREKMRKIFSDEKGAVDIVAIVVMIGIAVVLAVLFRKEIEGLIKSLLAGINGDAQKAVASTGN